MDKYRDSYESYISEELSSESSNYSEDLYEDEKKDLDLPIITHQIWKGAEMPKIFQDYRDQWLKMFPNYNHMFHKDDDLRNLIQEHYPKYLSTYDSFRYEIERIDFFRCAMLHHYGGIYIDLDVLPLKPLDEFTSKRQVVLGYEPDEHLKHWDFPEGKIIGNALMISPKGDDFWLNLMDYIQKSYVPGRSPVYNTGPICFGMFHRKHPEMFKNVLITEANCFYPITNNATDKTEYYKGKMYKGVSKNCDMKDAYVVHLWSGSWGKEVNSEQEKYIFILVVYLSLALVFIIVLLYLSTLCWG